ncbi:MAG: hypothetical protein DI595_22810, partial [Agrobacterium fabrum]
MHGRYPSLCPPGALKDFSKKSPDIANLARGMHLRGQPLNANALRWPKPREASRLRIVTYERFVMTKFKLEYIWLDGYKPVP